jgi:hypothetical protein
MKKIGWVATGGHRFSSGDDQVNVFFLFFLFGIPFPYIQFAVIFLSDKFDGIC